MKQALMMAINTHDEAYLRQLLMRSAFFYELSRFISEDELSGILSAVMLAVADDRNYLDLRLNSAYIFLKGGLLVPRKLLKVIDVSHRTIHNKIKVASEVEKQLKKVQNSDYQVVKHMESYSTFFLNSKSKITTLTYVGQTSQSIAIEIPLNQLTVDTLARIRDYYSDKARCLYNFDIFQSVGRPALESYCNFFELLEFNFNQDLFKAQRRDYEGDAQVKAKNMSPIIKKAPAIIYGQAGSNTAKCVTSQSRCYFISRQGLQRILNANGCKKEDTSTYNGDETMRCIKESARSSIDTLSLKASRLILPYHQRADSTSPKGQEAFRTNEHSQRSVIKLESINSSRRSYKRGNSQQCLHSPQQSLQLSFTAIETQLGNTRSLKLKRHFSNYINRQFNLYSEKKLAKYGEQFYAPQRTVLYQMKRLVSKQPEMTSINVKMRQLRLNKPLRYKENMMKKRESEALGDDVHELIDQDQCTKKITQKIKEGIEEQLKMNRKVVAKRPEIANAYHCRSVS